MIMNVGIAETNHSVKHNTTDTFRSQSDETTAVSLTLIE
jgi:hypothetical protein